ACSACATRPFLSVEDVAKPLDAFDPERWMDLTVARRRGALVCARMCRRKCDVSKLIKGGRKPRFPSDFRFSYSNKKRRGISLLWGRYTAVRGVFGGFPAETLQILVQFLGFLMNLNRKFMVSFVSSPFAKGFLVGDSVLADGFALSLDFAVHKWPTKRQDPRRSGWLGRPGKIRTPGLPMNRGRARLSQTNRKRNSL
ncbi:hypothetical protein A2U01_0013687, partial [Trifolium medium]|nr:hypothetical protein [Trifolium medium]